MNHITTSAQAEAIAEESIDHLVATIVCRPCRQAVQQVLADKIQTSYKDAEVIGGYMATQSMLVIGGYMATQSMLQESTDHFELGRAILERKGNTANLEEQDMLARKRFRQAEEIVSKLDDRILMCIFPPNEVVEQQPTGEALLSRIPQLMHLDPDSITSLRELRDLETDEEAARFALENLWQWQQSVEVVEYCSDMLQGGVIGSEFAEGFNPTDVEENAKQKRNLWSWTHKKLEDEDEYTKFTTYRIGENQYYLGPKGEVYLEDEEWNLSPIKDTDIIIEIHRLATEDSRIDEARTKMAENEAMKRSPQHQQALQEILRAHLEYERGHEISPSEKEVEGVGQLDFYQVGRNASHSFYIGLSEDGRRFRYSVGEGFSKTKEGDEEAFDAIVAGPLMELIRAREGKPDRNEVEAIVNQFLKDRPHIYEDGLDYLASQSKILDYELRVPNIADDGTDYGPVALGITLSGCGELTPLDEHISEVTPEQFEEYGWGYVGHY